MRLGPDFSRFGHDDFALAREKPSAVPQIFCKLLLALILGGVSTSRVFEKIKYTSVFSFIDAGFV